eukprot:493187-Pyramimonas_sp.AAC.1
MEGSDQGGEEGGNLAPSRPACQTSNGGSPSLTEGSVQLGILVDLVEPGGGNLQWQVVRRILLLLASSGQGKTCCLATVLGNIS